MTCTNSKFHNNRTWALDIIGKKYSFRRIEQQQKFSYLPTTAIYMYAKKFESFDKCPHTATHTQYVPFLCQTLYLASCYFCCDKSYELTIWLDSFAHFYSQCALHHHFGRRQLSTLTLNVQEIYSGCIIGTIVTKMAPLIGMFMLDDSIGCMLNKWKRFLFCFLGFSLVMSCLETLTSKLRTSHLLVIDMSD